VLQRVAHQVPLLRRCAIQPAQSSVGVQFDGAARIPQGSYHGGWRGPLRSAGPIVQQKHGQQGRGGDGASQGKPPRPVAASRVDGGLVAHRFHGRHRVAAKFTEGQVPRGFGPPGLRQAPGN
jgi:hypothetical protein